MSVQRRYVIVIFFIGVFSGLACFFLLPLITTKYAAANKHTMALSLVFSVISLFNGLILFSYANKRPGLFIRAFMASMTVKFFIYMIILAVLAMNFRIYIIPIMIVFFSLFVLYTVIEKVMVFKSWKENGGS